MTKTGAAVVGLSVLLGSASARGEQTGAAAEKADVVAAVGCLKETAPNTWSLVNASAPVTSHANAPSAKEIASLPKGGTNEFQLIGVAVFNLPSHRDHTVVVKGLHIKAAPASRLNVTSVTMVSATCEAQK